MNEIKSRADLFEAAAKMMRMCDEAKHCYVYKFDGLLYRGLDSDSFMYQSERYEFPLAIVEGKPVFKGDELYDSLTGKVKVGMEAGLTVRIDGKSDSWNWDRLSWLPPKPRTVLVELLREDAEHAAMNWIDNIAGPMTNIGAACRKALENEK